MSAEKGFFLFRYRQFFKLWLGQVTSQAGTRIYQIAMIWWIMSIAGEQSGFSLGVFMVAGALPSLLFFKLIGRLVDRLSPKTLMVCSDLSSAAMMAFIAFSLSNNSFTLHQAYFFGFLVSLVECFFNPSLAKSLPALVPNEGIEPAVAYQASTQHLASFGGAVLGAVMIGYFGIPMLVFLNSISYLFSALIEYTLVFAKPETAPGDAQAPRQSGVAAKPVAKLEWKKFPRLRQLLFGFGMINFFATPILLTLPLYVKNLLKLDATALGIFEAALWFGILSGTFVAARIKSEGRTIKTGAWCMAAMGLGLLIPGLSNLPTMIWIGLFVTGLSLGINNVKFVTLFQRVVPQAIKGQFFASLQALVSFTFPVSYLVFGQLGDRFAADRVFLIQGGGVVMVSLFFAYMSRYEASLGDELAQEESKT